MVRQVLDESVVRAGAGGLLGTVPAVWSVPSLLGEMVVAPVTIVSAMSVAIAVSVISGLGAALGSGWGAGRERAPDGGSGRRRARL
jgi:hypothetical protein